MILGFDLFGFASAGALPFPGGIAIVTPHIDNSPHLASPEGEGQIVLVRLKQVDKQDSA